MVSHSHFMELIKEGDRYRIWAWRERTNYRFERVDPERPIWRLSAIEQRTGHISLLKYDSAGRLGAIDQSPLRRLHIGYNGSDLIERIELVESASPPQPLVEYRYDAESRLRSVVDASGAAIRYDYDAAHRLVAETSRLGATFRFEYDAEGRCIHTFGDGGFDEKHLGYDPVARRTLVRDPQGAQWIYDMSPTGLVVRERDPLGGEWRHTYDLEDRLVLSEDPLGRFLRLAYDAEGRLASATDGEGRTSSYRYGPQHLPIAMVHADGSTETWEYDNRGNLAAHTNEAGDRRVFERDAQGRLAAAITPRGHRTDIAYAPDGRSHVLRDSFGWMRFEYNARGDLVGTSDSLGPIDTYRYDDRGNRTAILHADGSIFSFAYDANGNIVSDTDELGRVTRYRYDRFGTLVERTHPDGTTLRMFHNCDGRMTALENEKGERCTFRLDLLGRVVAQTFFDGRTEEYSFDPCGQLVGIRKPDGAEIAYKYDRAGRTLEISADGRTLARFGYDARERTVRAESATCTVELAYNPVGGLIREVQRGHVIECRYDSEGNCIAQHWVDGPAGEVLLEYDLRRRLVAVRAGRQTLQTFEYDPRDRPIRRRSRGPAIESRAYDSRGRLCAQEVRGADGGLLARRNYEYDTVDSLVERRDLRWGSIHYRYDARDRLIEQARGGASPDTFLYDACGNIESSASGSFASLTNRLVSAPGRHFRYDANGLPIEIQDPQGNLALAYDPLERLVEAQCATGEVFTYQYDPFARRLAKVGPEGTTELLWAGHQLRAERHQDGTSVEYLNVRYNPLAQWTDGAWYTVVCDQAMVPRELLDPRGQVVSRTDYDGFCALIAQEGTGPHSPFRLPGQYADHETGLYQNRFRFFDPATARFIQPDPTGLFGGINEYRYAENAVNYRDPLGLKCKLVHFRVTVNPKVGSRADYIAKRDAFNQARQNPNARIPTKTDYDTNIRPAANREAAAARAAGGYSSSDDADHPGDVRATGLLGQTLNPLDSGVNRSAGSQVGSQIRNDPSTFSAGQRTPMMDLVDQNGKLIP
jgi:RHS repeat-associated protein